MAETEIIKWEETLASPASTLRDVIELLNKNKMQIVIIVDDERKIIGTITDGDVRRAFLRGESLDSSIKGVMFIKPTVILEGTASEVVREMMEINKVYQVPVVNNRKQVVGLHFFDNKILKSTRDNTILIMAGGFGKRMMPFTENCPKPMLLVAGRPMLERIIINAISDGFTKFVISLFYMPEAITDFFGDGSKWNCDISYIWEDTPLGTAGALSLLQPKPDMPLIVTNGDVLTDVKFSEMLEFHLRNKAVATMGVRQYEVQNPFGVVQTKGLNIIGFEEKPVYHSQINAGLYVLDPEGIESVNKNEYLDMPSLFEKLNSEGRSTIIYPIHEGWMDVGQPIDLNLANEKLFKDIK